MVGFALTTRFATSALSEPQVSNSSFLSPPTMSQPESTAGAVLSKNPPGTSSGLLLGSSWVPCVSSAAGATTTTSGMGSSGACGLGGADGNFGDGGFGVGGVGSTTGGGGSSTSGGATGSTLGLGGLPVGVLASNEVSHGSECSAIGVLALDNDLGVATFDVASGVGALEATFDGALETAGVANLDGAVETAGVATFDGAMEAPQPEDVGFGVAAGVAALDTA